MEKKDRCFRGYCPKECPLKEIDIERSFWMLLAIIEAVVIVVRIIL